jgi:hypothetical protein
MSRTTVRGSARRGLLLSALCGALALSACSTGTGSAAPSGAGTATSKPAVSRSADAPASSAAPVVSTPGKQVLPDGTHDAYLTKVDAAARTVSFDKVEMLTGAAAVKAYQKENPGATDGPPNDYFMVNDNKLVRTLPVSDTVAVAVIDFTKGVTPTASTFAGLPAYLANKDNSTLFKLTVKSGKITSLTSIYTP